MISVIIPVYKNKDLFLKNLRHNLSFIKDQQVIVVNDNPEENLTASVKSICPQAVVINNSRNYGFARSMNLGVGFAKGDYLLFLNSDVLLMNNHFSAATKMFKDAKLLALSFAQIEADGHITGANAGKFSQGLFHHYEKQCQTLCSNLWPEGGASLLSRGLFQNLGGFDEIYSPFYWEDVDLGYRAHRQGYRVLFYPQITVRHHHQTTINKYFALEQIKTIAYRNQFIFVWKNIRGWQLLAHWLWLPVLILKQRRNREFQKGIKQAFTRFFLHQ